ncbi:MAG: asparagine synthase (glutamine-hydrolyzing) [Bacteroidota bacterium]
MCRIVGFWDYQSTNRYDQQMVLESMRDTMAYGGPDAAGIFQDDPVFLGHRRLSILDLSAAGNQPLEFQDHVIIFNGEVYNYVEIREKLRQTGISFRTNTDTEVILKAFIHWGPEAVESFRGMFAFAIWEKRNQKLYLFRDRMGVKPLFWYWKDGLFMFASELKAFHEHPNFDKSIDQEAVNLYLQQGYIPSPKSIFSHVRKVLPGSFLTLSSEGDIESHTYWDCTDYYPTTPATRSEEEILWKLETLLTESFQLRMVSDVPVGVFLSGGTDSSLVTAILQKNSTTPLNTFTIGFEDPAYNEAEHAKQIAAYLGTNHTELYCTEADFTAHVDELADFFDEPMADDAAIPTHLVSKLARQSVKVSLSADGGDELFGGYSKYLFTKNVFPKLRNVPRSLSHVGHKLLKPLSPEWVEGFAKNLPVLKNYTNIGTKFPKLVNALEANSERELFHNISTNILPADLANLHPYPIHRYDKEIPIREQFLVSLMGIIDLQTYLEGAIMPKVDRASMQVALEGREPFLDQHIVEFALSLEDDFKIRGKSGKYILKQLLHTYIPAEIIDRPKQGFVVPINRWLKSSYAKELVELQENKSFHDAFQLDASALKHLIEDFMGNKGGVSSQFMWTLFVLYRWYLRWLAP